jgi:hypothetical protein
VEVDILRWWAEGVGIFQRSQRSRNMILIGTCVWLTFAFPHPTSLSQSADVCERGRVRFGLCFGVGYAYHLGWSALQLSLPPSLPLGRHPSLMMLLMIGFMEGMV